jgi:hypothetical protein
LRITGTRDFAIKKTVILSMWHTPIIPAFRRLGQADFEFKASLSYIA